MATPITQNIYLHLIPDVIRPKLYLSQFDSGYEKLQFHLIGTNDYYTIPTGASVLFVGTKADRTMFSYACTYSGHTAVCDITEQMTMIPGKVDCELIIFDRNGNSIGSVNIDLCVERSALHGVINSANDFKSAAEEIMNIHQETVTAVNAAEAAAAALTQVNSAKNSAVSTITSNKNAAVEEMYNAVGSVHEYIQNGFSVYYTANTYTLSIIN